MVRQRLPRCSQQVPVNEGTANRYAGGAPHDVALPRHFAGGGPTMDGGANMQELIREGLKVPRDARAKRRLEELVARGEFEAIDPAGALSSRPRYLVTFMKSVTAFRIRSATV